MAKSIELVVDFETGETKTFYQPKHIKGSIALEGLEIGKELQKKGENDIDRSDIERIADFVATHLYLNKFSREELIDGLDARKLFVTLMDQLSSILGGDESENFTKGKKA